MLNLVSEYELCKILNVGRNFIYRCRKQGLPYIRLGSKVIRYDLNSVMQWFEENPFKN